MERNWWSRKQPRKIRWKKQKQPRNLLYWMHQRQVDIRMQIWAVKKAVPLISIHCQKMPWSAHWQPMPKELQVFYWKIWKQTMIFLWSRQKGQKDMIWHLLMIPEIINQKKSMAWKFMNLLQKMYIPIPHRSRSKRKRKYPIQKRKLKQEQSLN